MTSIRKREWRELVADAVRDAMDDAMHHAVNDIVDAVLEIERDEGLRPAASQQERIFVATLELLVRFQEITGTSTYWPSIYAVAHEFHLTPEDVLFLQKAARETRVAA